MTKTSWGHSLRAALAGARGCPPVLQLSTTWRSDLGDSRLMLFTELFIELFRLKWLFMVVCPMLILGGCLATKQYPGPERPKKEIAIIRGYQGPDRWTPSLLQGVPTPFITHLDGKSLGLPHLGAPHSVQVLPGTHAVTFGLEHWWFNYCITLDIDVEAGKTYLYVENGDPPRLELYDTETRVIVASEKLDRVSAFAFTCPVQPIESTYD